ncbi:MAG TPA: hypothetical protein PKK26_08970, partial [Candidatus Wallbacteria bacterium]|nr:hypothetical protein [Candidatus Wallbacteria bacterium]
MSDGNGFKKNQIITFFCDKILTHGPEDIPNLFSSFYDLLESFAVTPEKKFFHVDFLQKLSSEHIKSDSPNKDIVESFFSFLNSDPASIKIKSKPGPYLQAYCDDLLKLFDAAIRESMSFDARTRDGLLSAIASRVKSFASVMTGKIGDLEDGGDKREKSEENVSGIWRQKFSKNFTVFMDGLRSYFQGAEIADFIVKTSDPARPEMISKNDQISSLAGREDIFWLDLALKAKSSKPEIFPIEGVRVAAIKIDRFNKLADIYPFSNLVLIRTPEDESQERRGLIFIEMAAARLKAADLNIGGEFESLVHEISSKIAASIPAAENPPETFEEYLQSLIGNICAATASKYGAAIIGGGKNAVSILNTDGPEPGHENKARIESALNSGEYRLAVSTSIAEKRIMILDGKCRSFHGEKAFGGSALIMPIFENGVNVCTLVFFHDENGFFDTASRIAFETASRIISTAVIAARNYFEIKRSFVAMQNSHE